MVKSIVRLNIDHYRKLLANELNETRRRELLRLLAEEEAKLAALENLPKSTKNIRRIPSTPASEWVAHQAVPWLLG